MADAEDKQLKAMDEQTEGVWKPRLAAAADPFESSLQRERVRRLAFTHFHKPKNLAPLALSWEAV